ncbi:MAG: GntR family transcriptional regulator [Pseudomonadota bacterium]
MSKLTVTDRAQADLGTKGPSGLTFPEPENMRGGVPEVVRRATTTGSVYDKLRDGLMWGRWAPGEKLKPQHLRETMEATPAALREALIRLAGEGFVSFEEQRGFSTIVPTRKSFAETRHLRVLIEVEAMRLSLKNATLRWESDLVAAHQRLAQLEKSMGSEDDVRGFIRVWSTYDWAFHMALIANCGSDLLIEAHRTSYDRYRLHAVAELQTFGFRGETTVKEHGAVLQAALDRDTQACAHALDDHLRIYRRDGDQVTSLEFEDLSTV